MVIDEPPNYPLSLQRDVGWLINRISRVRAELLQDRLDALGLSARGAAMLVAVDELPKPVAQQEICAALLLDQASVATIADRLDGVGLISRRRDPRNRRRYVVELTPEGREVLSKARVVTAEVEDQMRLSLSDDDVGTLHTLLRRVAVEHGLL